MKHASILTAFLFLLFSVSCKKDNSNSTNLDRSAVETGKWKITNFIHNSVDETANFASYEFTFSPTGSVSAISSAITINGIWSLGTDDSKEKLILSFANAQFEDLSEDWLVIKIDSSVIQLSHSSGGNGGTETLTFGKK